MAVAQIRRQRHLRTGTAGRTVVDYVPHAPDEREKYLYYGSQGRWIFCVFLLAFAGVMFGLSRLAGNSMWTSLLYELIALQVAAVLISLLSSTRKRRSSRAEPSRSASRLRMSAGRVGMLEGRGPGHTERRPPRHPWRTPGCG